MGKQRRVEFLTHEAAVRKFLEQCGRNWPRGKRRSKKRRFTVSIEELDDEPVAPSKTPWVEIADAFGAVLRHLSMQQRRVLLCRIAGTMSEGEIARALGTTTKAVRRTFERACEKARAKVSRDGL